MHVLLQALALSPILDFVTKYLSVTYTIVYYSEASGTTKKFYNIAPCLPETISF